MNMIRSSAACGSSFLGHPFPALRFGLARWAMAVSCSMLLIYGMFRTALLHVFFSSTPRFLVKRFQLHAFSSRKKGGVVRAPKTHSVREKKVELWEHLKMYSTTLVFCGRSLWWRVCEAVPNTSLHYQFQIKIHEKICVLLQIGRLNHSISYS